MKKIDHAAQTMRQVLSNVASIFDLLSIIGPVTIIAKVFMQSLWKLKLSWDEKLPDEFSAKWRIISEYINANMKISVPRCCVMKTSVKLHSFSDASAIAYGSVVYFKSEEITSLVISKSQVAPMKKLMTPQLKLTAATISTRLVTYVMDTFKEAMKFVEINMWIDSPGILHWIKNDSLKLNLYVQ